MLKTINHAYLIIAIVLYLALVEKYSIKYGVISTIHIFTALSYYSILQLNYKMNKGFYKRTNLTIEIFLYTLFFITFNNIISYSYDKDFFVFNKADTLFYHQHVLEMLHMKFSQAIDYYLSYMGTDDLGMILILYPLYHIAESNLILNFLYLFTGIISSLSIFSIGKNFMSRKYAFLSALSYSISSFVIYFHSIGLKESFMIMLVILSFDFYYRFIKNKNFINLIISFAFIASLLLFRPAIAAMIIVAIGLGSLLSKKGGIGIKFLSFLIILFLISMAGSILAIIERYSAGGFEMLIYARESQGMIISSLSFTYTVNILAQIIGPLPTLISAEKISLTFFGSGLIYRVLLAFPFWLGIRYIFKTKSYKIYPLVIFVLIEMMALALLLEGLELRKALPHIPIVFIIAFWFLDKYDNKIIVFKRSKRFKLFFRFSIFLLAMIILFWNFR